MPDGRRLAAALVMVVAVLTPSVLITAAYWRDAGSAGSATRAEQRGVGYLRPLTALVAALADAQSEAVMGRPVDVDAVHRALDGVASADERDGRALGAHDTWAGLRSDILKLLTSPATGTAAYSGFSAVVDQSLFLASKVGDTSQLILDPELDTYYLMDASLLRLPALLADSGRLVDLNALRLADAGGVSPAQVLAARDRTGTESTAVQTSLSKSFNSTTGPTFGPDLLTKIDAFRTAMGALAPSTSLIAQPLPADQASLQSARAALAKTAMQLDTTVLDQLNELLATRLTSQSADRDALVPVWVAGIGPGLLLVLLVGGLLRRRVAVPAPSLADARPEPAVWDGTGRGFFEPRRSNWRESAGADR